MSLLITPETKISQLIDAYPFLIEFLPTIYPGYKKLSNPLMRKTLGKMVTMGKAAQIGGIPVMELIRQVQTEIEKQTAGGAGGGSAVPDRPVDREKIEELSRIIKELHKGGDMESLKIQFNDLIEDVSPAEIPRMEQILIDEGMPTEELTKLSVLHVQIFKDTLEKHEKLAMPPGHPIHTFMKENAEAERLCAEIMVIVSGSGESDQLPMLIDELSQIDLHFLRKENQLFPKLEIHDITGPSTVMWAIHDEIRASLKEAKSKSGAELYSHMEELVTAVKDMNFKEESILYPLCIDTLSEAEWGVVRRGEEEIGYAWVEPEGDWEPEPQTLGIGTSEDSEVVQNGMVKLDTGVMSIESLNLMLKHLPVDIQFVDADDRVAYYSDTPVRIFPRSPGVIGREVRKCHPPKSVEVVSKILEEFKAGNRDDAEFWITLNERFLHIKYTAVRDSQGTYIGTVEVSQDITELRKLEGQNRLLDWD